MDGSTLNGNTRATPGASFVDVPVNGWNHNQQQQEFIKPPPPQQQLGAYDPAPINGYVAVTSGPADSDVKPSLLSTAQAGDFSEMQRLSQDYTPVVHGPLVGHLKSSKAIAIEYANADPTFVRKTSSLSQKYDSYRTIRGDGNCGWRAVAFGFFELLLRSGDQDRIGMEHARITSLNGLMESVGLVPYVYEDFAEETFSVFRTLSSGIAPTDDSALVNTFNTPEVSDSIVTHFKFLTSAWMKSNPDPYQPFLDGPIEDYCGTQIEPYGVEIDHVGLMALIDCLVLPAGMAVEIIYLDRSDVDEVNVHRFEKLEGDGVLTPPDAPVLRLLYRPGHYDIVYKVDLPTPPPAFASDVPAQSVQVAFISAIPEQTFESNPIGAYQELFTPYDGGFDPHPASNPVPSNFRQSVLSIPEFQPSLFQPLPFQTTTFRNSPFNPSHFQSENFQPEIYQPPTSPTSTSHSKKVDRHDI